MVIFMVYVVGCYDIEPDNPRYKDDDKDGYSVSIDGSGIDALALRETSDPDDQNPFISPVADDLTMDGIDQNGDGIDGNAFDQYGGWIGMQLEATGNFRVEKIGNRWWFVTPEGHPFFMNASAQKGLINQDGETYAQMAQQYGFNTIGIHDLHDVSASNGVDINEGYTSKHFPGTTPFFLRLSVPLMNQDGVIDFFTAEWENTMLQRVLPLLERFNNNPRLLGYIYHIEPHWFPDHKRPVHVFDDYIRFDAQAPGKLFLVEFIREYYEDNILEFNRQWDQNLDNFDEIAGLKWLGPESFFKIEAQPGGGINSYNISNLLTGFMKGLFFSFFDTEKLLSEHQAQFKNRFAGAVARQYYKSIYDVVKNNSPHLILGHQQIVISGSSEVVKVAAEYSDVCSTNPFPESFWAHAFAQTLLLLSSGGHSNVLMSTGFGTDLVSDQMELVGDKPFILEFGVVGDNTSHPNSVPGNFAVLPDQKTRSEFVEHTYNLYLQSNQVIGIQYYSWGDQPVGGEGGFVENNQFGLVNVDGQLYEEFSNRIKELNNWWLLRLQTSHQEVSGVLEPLYTSSGKSTGSIHRLQKIRNFSEWSSWMTTAWFKQDYYTMAKSNEIWTNKARQLINPDAPHIKWAQRLYGLKLIYEVPWPVVTNKD